MHLRGIFIRYNENHFYTEKNLAIFDISTEEIYSTSDRI